MPSISASSLILIFKCSLSCEHSLLDILIPLAQTEGDFLMTDLMAFIAENSPKSPILKNKQMHISFKNKRRKCYCNNEYVPHFINLKVGVISKNHFKCFILYFMDCIQSFDKGQLISEENFVVFKPINNH